jgi:hypothetical protein
MSATASSDQREARDKGLLTANRCRLNRAAFKARLTDQQTARIHIALALEDVPECLLNADVGAVLRWIPRFGQGRGGTDRAVRQTLDRAGVQSETRRLRDLTSRQRECLAGLLLSGAEVLAERQREARITRDGAMSESMDMGQGC